MKRNYDSVALFYDRLARLAYGNTLANAQLYVLNALPQQGRMLIAGGGAGWILEEIAKVCPAGLTIDYIDASPKMISLARRRNTGGNKVTFITSPVQDVPFGPEGYDVIFTPFLLDNFTDSTLQKIFLCLDKQLSREGVWLYCDFQNTDNFLQKVLLRAMYSFFRFCCGIEASRLPDAAALFSENRYRMVGRRTYMKDFIVAAIYKRDNKISG